MRAKLASFMELIHVDPRLRRKIRLWVYSGFALFVVGMIVATGLLRKAAPPNADATWMNTDYASLREVQLLQEYVAIDTSIATGSELAGAEFLARELEAAGIPAHLERLGENEANLWAILEGESPEALVLHNHIDVTPAGDLAAWRYPPFEGTIDLPRIYGRGTFDMKSVAIAQLQALKALTASGRKPLRSVIFLATGSEEVGSELGTRWVLERHPELTERMWAVLTEGGVVEPVSRTEIKYWGVEFAQRRYADVIACAGEIEPLLELRRDLAAWSQQAAPWTVPAEVQEFLAAYAGTRTHPDYQALQRQTWEALHHPERFKKLPRYLRSMFRNEIFASEPRPNPEGGYTMRIVLHMLPGQSYEKARERLLPDWITHGIPTTFRGPLGADHGSPTDHPAYIELLDVIREAFPDVRVGPYFVPGSATDSRFFREKGIPSYGFSPFLIFSPDTFSVDGPNERIDLPGYVGGVELYRAVVDRLAG
jgi:acetylornithine deacetylase/succinyl-diaminopimelate desuccinylase-like protein